jgi:hypothetical protein
LQPSHKQNPKTTTNRVSSNYHDENQQWHSLSRQDMHEVLSKTDKQTKEKMEEKRVLTIVIHLARKKKEDRGAAKTREYTRQP